MDAPSPDWDAERIVAHLEALDSAENRAGMARFGIRPAQTFGVSVTTLRQLARKLKRDHARALALWETGSRDARLMAAFTADANRITPEQAVRWASDFDSWDVVDGVADIFAETPGWRDLILRFAADEREFVCRTAFAMIAWAAVHRKEEPDGTFIAFLQLIERRAGDPRNYVKKAVNWALRQIGKRSMALHGPALELARQLAASADRTARWVGRDAERELTAQPVLARLEAKESRSRG